MRPINIVDTQIYFTKVCNICGKGSWVLNGRIPQCTGLCRTALSITVGPRYRNDVSWCFKPEPRQVWNRQGKIDWSEVCRLHAMHQNYIKRLLQVHESQQSLVLIFYSCDWLSLVCGHSVIVACLDNTVIIVFVSSQSAKRFAGCSQ